MTVIAEKDRPTVRDLLARELSEDVELLLFTRGRSNRFAAGSDAGLTCDETHELLEELAGLSERLHLTAIDVDEDIDTSTRFNVTALPTVIIRRRDLSKNLVDLSLGRDESGSGPLVSEPGGNVRFLGLPGGYEFSTLLADIVDVSKGRVDLSAETRSFVEALDTSVHLQVFVTPSCPYCPRAARMAHQMAMLNPMILADVIEANEFQEISERYQVRSVPMTVINNRIQFVGSLPEAKVVDAIKKAVTLDG